MLVAGKLSKQQLHDFEEMEEEGFEGYFEAGEARPFIPEGIYKARCIKIEKGNYYGSPKINLIFQITESYEHEGVEIPMYMPAYKKVPAASKYYEQWIIANGNKPSRKDKMTPLIFKGHLFEAVVKTVKPKNKDGSYKPENLHYSKVDYLKDKIN